MTDAQIPQKSMKTNTQGSIEVSFYLYSKVRDRFLPAQVASGRTGSYKFLERL